MSRGFGRIIGRKTLIRQCDDASASCSGSSQLDPPSASSACTPPFTTPSTFNATSSPDPHCGNSEPKLSYSGKMLSQRHDALASFGSRCVLVVVTVTKPLEVIRVFTRSVDGEELAE